MNLLVDPDLAFRFCTQLLHVVSYYLLQVFSQLHSRNHVDRSLVEHFQLLLGIALWLGAVILDAIITTFGSSTSNKVTSQYTDPKENKKAEHNQRNSTLASFW